VTRVGAGKSTDVAASSAVGAGWRRLKSRWAGLDHLEKALVRYFVDSSDRLAASITYYGFLCLFPLLLLVASVVGFVVRGDLERQRQLLARLGDYLPDTLAGQLVQVVAERAGTTGIIGIVGLTIAGLGWIDTLRESIRAVWHQAPHSGNIALKKVKDLLILFGLGVTLLVSMAISAFATALTREGLELLGSSGDDTLATVLLRVVGLGLALLADVVILVYLLLWLPRTAEPFRRVLRGAVVGAVGLEVAKYLGFFYFGVVIDRGADLYGVSLATAVGLLVWINIMARLVMFAAAWTVTGPYRRDVRPSGTAPEPAPEPVAEAS